MGDVFLNSFKPSISLVTSDLLLVINRITSGELVGLVSLDISFAISVFDFATALLTHVIEISLLKKLAARSVLSIVRSFTNPPVW